MTAIRRRRSSPTPSWAIIASAPPVWLTVSSSPRRTSRLPDVTVTPPPHNPPPDGGFKYNPPNGGPADTDATGWIEKTANDFIKAKVKGVTRGLYEQALRA